MEDLFFIFYLNDFCLCFFDVFCNGIILGYQWDNRRISWDLVVLKKCFNGSIRIFAGILRGLLETSGSTFF